MLRALTIQNVVLIKHLELVFEHGLSVLSGETGAGKSILLDALGLALGQRGESRLVRKGQPQAIITATFDLPPNHPCFKLLEGHGLPFTSEGILLRRILTSEGRSRAFVNDQPVSIGLLSLIGEELIEIHGQFDRLLEPRHHRDFLDDYAGSQDLLALVKTAHEEWTIASAAFENAKALAAEKQLNEAFLRHALEELRAADIKPGEEVELLEKRTRIANAAKIADITQDLASLLEGEHGARSQVNRGLRLCEKGLGLSENAFTNISRALTTAAAEIEETTALLKTLLQECAGGPAQLDKIEGHLITLRSLSRKHHCTVEELLKVRENLDKNIDLIDNSDMRLSELERQTAQAKQVYLQRAEQLSQDRQAAASRLDTSILTEFAPLKLGNAQFRTQVLRFPENQWGPHGIDQVKFLVATNKGSAFGDLKTIASGGERSRFMLALKVMFSQLTRVPTLIFDEIDTGIGGATARAVGERLASLSQSLQVLTITHSPQVASLADHHWRVEKVNREEATETTVILLSQGQRREEIARMLAGENITEEARAAADQLLQTG